MGIIKAITSSVKGALADSWKEMYICEALPPDMLITKGEKLVSENSSNTKETSGYISDGSIIAVADGTCALVIENGKVHSVFTEPGENIFRSDKSAGFFSSGIAGGIKSVAKDVIRRFRFGGVVVPVMHRVYYVNTREMMGNYFATEGAIPFHVYDKKTGLSMDASLTFTGTYSFKITDPVSFYSKVSGNVSESYGRNRMVKQMNSELMPAFCEAFKKLGIAGIRPYQLPEHTMDLCKEVNTYMSNRWTGIRGIEIVSMALSSLTLITEDTTLVQEMQHTKVLAENPALTIAVKTNAQAEAMVLAAGKKT